MVDIYLVNLDTEARQWPDARTMLAPEEIERASRLRDPAGRHRFQLARMVLRSLLGSLLAVEPHDVRLEYTSRGKPFVQPGPAFNLSHSGPWLLIGIAAEGRIGVDIEVQHEWSDSLELAAGVFTAEERGLLERAGPDERSRLFLRTWTRKESLAKASGVGLGARLDTIPVLEDELAWPGSGAIESGEREPPLKWCIRSVDLGPEVVAAVAWDRPEFSIRDDTMV